MLDLDRQNRREGEIMTAPSKTTQNQIRNAVREARIAQRLEDSIFFNVTTDELRGIRAHLVSSAGLNQDPLETIDAILALRPDGARALTTRDLDLDTQEIIENRLNSGLISETEAQALAEQSELELTPDEVEYYRAECPMCRDLGTIEDRGPHDGCTEFVPARTMFCTCSRGLLERAATEREQASFAETLKEIEESAQDLTFRATKAQTIEAHAFAKSWIAQALECGVAQSDMTRTYTQGLEVYCEQNRISL